MPVVNQPETEKVAWNRMQIKRTVGLAAMQINSDTGNRDMGKNQRVRQNFPSGRAGQSVRQKI